MDSLEQVFTSDADENGDKDLLHHTIITEELKATLPSLRRIVAKAVETNAIVPSLSASLEWLKYSTDTILPTQFYEVCSGVNEVVKARS